MSFLEFVYFDSETDMRYGANSILFKNAKVKGDDTLYELVRLNRYVQFADGFYVNCYKKRGDIHPSAIYKIDTSLSPVEVN